MGAGCRWEPVIPPEDEEGEEEEGLQKEGEWTDRPKDKDKDLSEALPSALSMAMVVAMVLAMVLAVLVTLGRLALQHRAPQRDRVDPWQEKGTGPVCLDQDPGGKMATLTADPPALETARKVSIYFCDRGYDTGWWDRVVASLGL